MVFFKGFFKLLAVPETILINGSFGHIVVTVPAKLHSEYNSTQGDLKLK